jgi:deoxycytidylate deaminase
MHLAINAGVTRIVYAKRYGDPTHIGDRAAWSLETAKKLGIEMSFFEPS